MKRKSYILTYDFGTSSLKGVLFDKAYRIRGVAYAGYPTYSPRNGRAEQKAEDYWDAMRRVTGRLLDVSEIDARGVAGIAMSQTTADVIFTDEEGAALDNCVIWIDARASAEAEDINRRVGRPVYQGKNVPPKVMWYRHNRPEIFGAARWLLDVSAYMFRKMTGHFAYELTGAFGSQMLSEDFSEWSDWKLEASEIPREMLPERIVSASEIVGYLLPEAARQLGLAPGVPVFGGCSDNANGQIGAGCIRSGDTHVYLGSSAWFEVTTSKDEEFAGPYPSVMPGMRYHFRCTDSACSSVDYLLSAIRPDGDGHEKYERMERDIARDSVHPENLLFFPFLFGEQDPVADMFVRGSMLNIKPTVGRGHILKAVMEGVGYNLRWMKDQQIEQTRRWTSKRIRIFGGGSQSDAFTQTIADVTGDELARIKNPQTAGNLGLAVCAAIGLGLAEDFTVLDAIVEEDRIFTPDPEAANRYEFLYPIYREGYNALKKIYAALNHENR
ncbi:MAG: hypothetical protein LBS35_09455 [Synergistaceae bacterium]|nr:hypothetical protein [Synergistaceae bacterium]